MDATCAATSPPASVLTIPTAARRYAVTIGVLGPLIIALGALLGRPALNAGVLAWGGILLVLAFWAEAYPIHAFAKTNLNVAAAAHVAAIVLLPWPLVGVVALGGGLLSHAWRRASAIEAVFNGGQSSLYVMVGALVTQLARTHQTLLVGRGPQLALAVLLASAIMHLANTALVALAVALQLGTHPLGTWWASLPKDLLTHLLLAGLGLAGGLVMLTQPLLLPALILLVVGVRQRLLVTKQREVVL